MGALTGDWVGEGVGGSVGALIGLLVGDLVGTGVGVVVGEALGDSVGGSVGTVGEGVPGEGCFVGGSVGATGLVEGHGIERALRDATCGLIYSGTSDIQRNLVSRMMGA